MSKLDIKLLDDTQKNELVNNRWSSSSELWDKVSQIYKQNTAVYSNQADWVNNLPYTRKRWAVHANRVFVNTEAVINSLIANPPGINILPARDGEVAQDFARKLESFFRKKYLDLNIKETMRMGYRNLYFARLIVIKPFWNPLINDFDFRAIDPRKVRFGKYARKELDSEFAIEEIEDNLCAVIERFPAKKKELMAKYGIRDEVQLYIKNPDVKYKEAWIGEYTIFKLENIILDTIKNPYWDWDGILITQEEEEQLNSTGKNADGTPKALQGEARRQLLQQAKLQQDQRQAEMAQQPSQTPQPQDQSATPPTTPATTPVPPVNSQAQPAQQSSQGGEMENPQEENAPNAPQEPTPPKYKPYFFNYFDNPRKPYIFATIFNNKNSPIGRTDMITLSSELQRGIDKRKMDIDENCELVNGIIKVDASVMGKSDAQRIRFETKGIIWGKGVGTGVTRETGTALPDMVFKDMLDSRSEIDNIMAASSAFRGEREGQETKAGRLALIQQSFLRLNELVQVGDYVAKEIFDWGMQLAKTRYTEYHYAKWMGKEDAAEVIEIIQDDFDTGSEVKIIAGKSLPVDDEFKFEQAQNDVKAGFLSPIDYLEIAHYDDAKTLAKNAFLYKVSPFSQFDISDEERMKIPPPLPQSRLTERIDYRDLAPAAKVQWLGRQGITVTEQQITEEGESSPVAIAFKDLPPDGQVQAAAKLGIHLDPAIVVAEHMAENAKANQEQSLKADAQAHGQQMAEKSQALSEKTANQSKPK